MSFKNLQTDIIKKKLCMMCGMCSVVCPNNSILLKKDKPTRNNKHQCKACSRCTLVCPGYDTGTSVAEKRLFGRNRTEEERWLGIIRNTVGGHATDQTVYEKSGSGGSVSSLLMASFDFFKVDCVIVAGRDSKMKWIASPQACFDRNSVVNYAQATYQMFPYLTILEKLFTENPLLKIGIVGLPCHVQAIRKAQNGLMFSERFRKNIKIVIEIACSTNTHSEGTRSLICDVAKIDLSEVESVFYREGTYPGNFVIHKKNCEKIIIPFWQAVRHFAKYKSFRCLSCPDWVSGLADISVWDGDPNVFEASKMNGSNFIKHSSIAVRTETGERLLDWAIREKIIKAWPKTNNEDNLGLIRKKNNRARFEQANCIIPIGPIPNYLETMKIVSDESLIQIN